MADQSTDTELIGKALLRALPSLERRVLVMGDQTKAQGSADRAEKLRGLSDYELGRFVQVCTEDAFYQGIVSNSGAGALLDAAEAEWDRRCAEREPQAAELERLRKAAREVARTYQQLDVGGDAALVLEAQIAGVELLKALGDEPQPQEASQ